MKLKIVLIYPELLGTYGDRGNALVLAHRARQRNIDTEIIYVSPKDKIDDSGDIYLLGGGEDDAQSLATRLLLEQKDAIEDFVNQSQFVAICAGFQILGREFPVANKEFHEGLNLIDATTTHGDKRIIGEILTKTNIETVGLLTGFENHGGRTTISKDATALGVVKKGFGNGVIQNDAQQKYVDGYFSENLICTYLHGPLFARNPKFADYVLARSLKTDISCLAEIDADPQEKLHNERVQAT